MEEHWGYAHWPHGPRPQRRKRRAVAPMVGATYAPVGESRRRADLLPDECEIYIRQILPTIRVPTLILHRVDDRLINPAGAGPVRRHRWAARASLNERLITISAP